MTASVSSHPAVPMRAQQFGRSFLTARKPRAFDYRPERLEPLGRAIRACTDNSFRETVANLLDRLAMIHSVPGLDIIHPELLPDGIPSPAEVARYAGVLQSLATPYAVIGEDPPRRRSPRRRP